MYPGWQIPQSGSDPRCEGIFWLAGEKRLRLLARTRAVKLVEVRTVETTMVEARMVCCLSQVLMIVAAVIKVREAATPVQRPRSQSQG